MEDKYIDLFNTIQQIHKTYFSDTIKVAIYFLVFFIRRN